MTVGIEVHVRKWVINTSEERDSSKAPVTCYLGGAMLSCIRWGIRGVYVSALVARLGTPAQIMR
jgi:hypothetical protein